MSPLVFALALAQENPDIDAQLLRPTADAFGLVMTDVGHRSIHNQLSARLLAHYAHEPVVYRTDDGTQTLLSSVTQSDLVLGYAYQRLRVGGVVPIVLDANGVLAGREAGLGDLAVDGRFTVVDPGEIPVGVALQTRIEMPTSTLAGPLGDPTVGWSAGVAADVEPVDRLAFAGNLAYAGGPRTELGQVTVNDYLEARGGMHLMLEEQYDVGVAGELAARGPLPVDGSAALSSVEWLGTVHGRIPDTWMAIRAGGGTALTQGFGAPDYRLLLGVGWEPPRVTDADGDGLVDRDDECPKEPEDLDGFEDGDGCPDVDDDGDGIVDEADRCRLSPEDIDQFQDDDGCPDTDNDGDGLTDAADACPIEAEDRDRFEDEDGCPEPEVPVRVDLVDNDGMVIGVARATIEGPDTEKSFVGTYDRGLAPGAYTVFAKAPGYDALVAEVVVPEDGLDTRLRMEEVQTTIRVTRERIELAEEIYFDTGKATIQNRSYSILDDAVAVLKEYAEIKKLRIEGHTDQRGSAELNLDLSRRRAASVQAYFVEQGIDPDRLSSMGFGEDRPIDPANNAAAWARNRRVDFFVESWVDSDPTP